jgi:hypothetical protein
MLQTSLLSPRTPLINFPTKPTNHETLIRIFPENFLSMHFSLMFIPQIFSFLPPINIGTKMARKFIEIVGW